MAPSAKMPTDRFPTDAPPRRAERKRNKHSNFDRLMGFLCFLGCFFLVCLLGALAFQAMHIYADLGRSIGNQNLLPIAQLGAESVKSWPLVGWLLSLSLRGIAALLQSLQITLFGLIFIMLFILLQTAEVGPTIVRSSPTVMANMIATFEKFTKLRVGDSDDDAIKRLKKDHNEYYSSFLSSLDWARSIAYLIDFLVCVVAAPIIKGGYSNWSNISLTFGWGDLDYTNLLRICITMFFFQWVVWVFIQFLKGFRLFSRRDT